MRLIRLLILAFSLFAIGESAFAQCPVTSSPQMDCSYGNSIDYFDINGTSLGSSYGCNDPSGYVDFGALGVSLNIGDTYSWDAQVGTYYYAQQAFGIWIDLNGDGYFGDDEMVASQYGCYMSDDFQIPCDATPGTVKLRTRCVYYDYYGLSGSQACDDYLWYGLGETEDYQVDIVGGINFDVQPVSTSICPGSNTTFTTTVSNATTYQWQVDDGTGFVDISNGGVYSNATTDALDITGATSSMDGYQYQLIASDVNCTKTSDAVVLTIAAPAAVTADPVDQPTCNGSTATFSMAASGLNLTYQWQVDDGSGSGFVNTVDGPVYNNSAAASLEVIASLAMDGYKYRAIVTGDCGTPADDTTAEATLIITPPPAVTVDPANTTGCEGGSTSISVTATGGIFSYQWQVDDGSGSGFVDLVDDANYSNTNTSTLDISNVPLSFDNYQYRVFIDGCITPATSNAATLTVNPAVAITADPTPNTTICPTFNTSFTAAASGLSVTYQWQVSTNGGSTWSNISNTGPYSNVTTTTMDITGAPASFDGNMYRMVASSSVCGAPVNSAAATLNVRSLTVTSQPVDITECEGSTATFNITAAASGLTYQWQESTDRGGTWNNISDGGPYSGTATSTLSVVAAIGMYNYEYRCQMTGSCLTATNSAEATLIVKTLPTITSQPVSTTVCDGNVTSSAGVFTVGTTGSNLTYQWQEDQGSGFSNLTSGGSYLNFTTNTLTVSNPPPSFSGYKYRCIVSGYCTPSVTSTDATLTVNTRPAITSQPVNSFICQGDNATFTVGAVATGRAYQWQAYDFGTSSWYNLSNGPDFSNVTTATLTVVAPAFNTNGSNAYRCVITGTCTPSVTTNSVYHFISTPPTITYQPQDAGGCLGGVATFTVTAIATTPTNTSNYQWQVDDGAGGGFVNLSNSGVYSDVTTNTLVITGVTSGMNGYQYRAIVSTSCGAPVFSAKATLITQDLPAVTSSPSSIAVCPGTPTTFTAAGTGTNINYQWQVNDGSGFVNILTSNPTYAGATSASMVAVAPTVSMNNYKYRCVISGACTPAVRTAVATLTVHNPVTIATQSINDSTCETNDTKIGVYASGAALIYQWQVQSTTIPGLYTDLLNVPPYSGVNRDSLTITAPSASLSGNVYRCRITEHLLCNLNFYTNDIPFYVNPAPVSTPATLTAPERGTATFSVPNTGTKYQWQENAQNTGFTDITDPVLYSGINTNTLIINTVNIAMSGNQYRCIVDGICVSPMASKPSTLSVDNGVSVKKMSWSDISMSVYPNPLSGTQLNISFNKVLKGKTDVKVLDKMGKLVYEGTITPGQNNTASIDLQALAAGVYLLQVNNAENNFNQTVNFTKQ